MTYRDDAKAQFDREAGEPAIGWVTTDDQKTVIDILADQIDAKLVAPVTAGALADGSVTSGKIAANGVNTAAIQDGAVTSAKLATSGRFTFPTGAANGYGFASGASHLSGTAAPEGVVTAAPGSTWLQTDSTVDVKGWIKWVKATGTGNTGWVAGPEADTGWRLVTADMINGWTFVGGGGLLIRRIGTTVHMNFASIDASGATSDVFYAPPAGFRFNHLTVVPWGNVSGKNFVLRGDGTMDSTARDAALYAYATYATPDAWPASLPGTTV